MKLSVANRELRPEEEGKLFVHDGLGALLLRALDLLEGHVAEGDGQLAGGLAETLRVNKAK